MKIYDVDLVEDDDERAASTSSAERSAANEAPF